MQFLVGRHSCRGQCSPICSHFSTGEDQHSFQSQMGIHLNEAIESCKSIKLRCLKRIPTRQLMKTVTPPKSHQSTMMRALAKTWAQSNLNEFPSTPCKLRSHSESINHMSHKHNCSSKRQWMRTVQVCSRPERREVIRRVHCCLGLFTFMCPQTDFIDLVSGMLM